MEPRGTASTPMAGQRRHPELPVIYVSAYPGNDVFHRGSPDPLVPFLQKPFSPEALLLMVRELLPDASLTTRQRTE